MSTVSNMVCSDCFVVDNDVCMDTVNNSSNAWHVLIYNNQQVCFVLS